MFRQRSRMLLIGIAFALVISVPVSYAQQVFGSIYGTVTDPRTAGPTLQGSHPESNES